MNKKSVGYCIDCQKELFYEDVKRWGNEPPHRYLKSDEGHPECPKCGLIDIDSVVKQNGMEIINEENK